MIAFLVAEKETGELSQIYVNRVWQSIGTPLLAELKHDMCQRAGRRGWIICKKSHHTSRKETTALSPECGIHEQLALQYTISPPCADGSMILPFRQM